MGFEHFFWGLCSRLPFPIPCGATTVSVTLIERSRVAYSLKSTARSRMDSAWKEKSCCRRLVQVPGVTLNVGSSKQLPDLGQSFQWRVGSRRKEERSSSESLFPSAVTGSNRTDLERPEDLEAPGASQGRRGQGLSCFLLAEPSASFRVLSGSQKVPRASSGISWGTCGPPGWPESPAPGPGEWRPPRTSASEAGTCPPRMEKGSPNGSGWGGHVDAASPCLSEKWDVPVASPRWTQWLHPASFTCARFPGTSLLLRA